MTHATTPINNVVVLGGNGAMGSLFCTQLVGATNQVIAIDLQPVSAYSMEKIRYLQADVCKLDQRAWDALSTADLVIAALPETVLMTAWRGITACQKASSLFVDTLSVKTPIIQAVSRSTAPSEIISINPMFAPSLGFSDQGIVIIDVRRGPIADAFTKLLESWGSRLVLLTAEQHDRHTAILQTLTHASILAFGISLKELNYEISAMDSIMPPPHRTLIALLARMTSADPEVYWEIQTSNPYAEEARRTLASSINELAHMVNKKKKQGFHSVLSDLETLIGADLIIKLNAYCTRIFKSKN